jgi:acyl dehydratase
MDYEVVRNWHFEPVVRDYTAQETILYNLAIGFGPRDLQQVWEERLEAAFPTMAFVLGWPGGWMKDPETGIDYTRVVHGEQRLKAFAPLPAVGRITGQSRVAHVVDKGVGKGAVVVTETELTDASGQTLALVTQSNFCRGDGGLAKSDPPPQGLAALPDRGCDRVADLFLPENAAALYRLCGDHNPLHIDPDRAARAGFDRPILHGLCTLGQVARVVSDGGGLTALDVRFSAPVFPGETLQVDMWKVEGGTAFRVLARDRGVTVLDRGFAGF